MRNRELLRIKLSDFGFVLDVEEHMSVSRANREFRLAANREHIHNATVHAIDRRDGSAASIKREDALGSRIVENRVWILAAGAGAGDGLQSLQIEDRNGIRAPVAHKSTAQIGSQRDPVNALSVRDVTDNL